MKRKKRIWQIFLLLLLVFAIPLSSFAGVFSQPSNREKSQNAASQSTSARFSTTSTDGQSREEGWRPNAHTYRMSLEELTNWDFTGYTGDALADRIQEYGEHFYVACSEEAMYGINSTFSGRPKTTTRGKGVIYQDTSLEKTNHLLNALQNTDGQFKGDALLMIDTTDGHRFINPDPNVIELFVNELKSIGGHNAAMAEKYFASRTDPSAAAHPIVLVIEVVGLYVGNGPDQWVSAADMCYKIKGEAAYRTLLTTDMKAKADSLLGRAPENAVEQTIAEICGYTRVNANHWPYDWTKRFYSTRRTTAGTVKNAQKGTSYYARQAWQTGSNQVTGINGCTMIQLGTAIPPATAADNPSGKYTWHIDAEGATITSSGHKEDQVVKLQGSTSGTITKTNIVGSLNINQDNAYEWENWVTALKAAGVKLEIHKYHLGQSSFTTQQSTIIANGSDPTGNGVTSTDRGNTQTVNLTLTEFKDALTNPDKSFDISTDVLGDVFENGELKVAYATQVYVIPKDNAGTELARAQLSNDQVHWINYTADNPTTYKFQQIVGAGYAQIKQGGLGSKEKFEAMAGTPTTEPLFIDMGGEQYVVNMQYRYVQEPYKRDYVLNIDDTPFFCLASDFVSKNKIGRETKKDKMRTGVKRKINRHKQGENKQDNGNACQIPKRVIGRRSF